VTHFFETDLQLDVELLRPLIRTRDIEPRKVVRWWELVSEMKSQVLRLAAPRGVFKFFSSRSAAEQLGSPDNPCALPRRFQGAEVIGLFGLTLGDKVERHASDLFALENYPEGYLTDLLGTYALTELQKKMLEKAKVTKEVADLIAGPQIQPGSRSWPLSAHQKFMQMLPLGDIGITMLESLALRPAKSKTFGCGFWRNE
jgi:hypothetical protein